MKHPRPIHLYRPEQFDAYCGVGSYGTRRTGAKFTDKIGKATCRKCLKEASLEQRQLRGVEQ